MSMQNAQSNGGFFNDEETISNSLQIKLTDNAIIVDISDKPSADFTNKDWDRILNTILTSSKIITV